MASVNSSSRSADKSPREKGLLLSPFIASFEGIAWKVRQTTLSENISRTV